jgi:hypothetical protein
MRAIRFVVSLAVIMVTVAAWAQSDAQKDFDSVKALDGFWAGRDQSGTPVKVSFRTTAAGSAVMSEITGKEDMISMFHLDGDRLLLTHYCAAGNQPRMKAVWIDGKTIRFDYVDATNLATRDAGHMQRMVLTTVDANHHIEEWIFNDHGKEMKEVFTLERQKPI